jgi:hypothetical protein
MMEIETVSVESPVPCAGIEITLEKAAGICPEDQNYTKQFPVVEP